MSDRCARIAVLIALIPAIVGVWILCMATLDVRGVDVLQAAFLAATGALCACVLYVWRHYVRWNTARVASTTGLTILTIGQVILWSPMLPVTGCGEADALRAGQSSSMAGLWGIGCGLIWWFALMRPAYRADPTETNPRSKRMTPNIARLAISLSFFPLGLGLFHVVETTQMYFGVKSDWWLGWSSLEACALFAVAAWLLLWRRSIVWNRRRRTVCIALGTAGIACPATILLPNGDDLFGGGQLAQAWEALRYTTPFFVCAAFIAGTAWSWRRVPGDAAEPWCAEATEIERVLRCPSCDYSLRGLPAARCPECGWSSTIDSLFAYCLELLSESDSSSPRTAKPSHLQPPSH